MVIAGNIGSRADPSTSHEHLVIYQRMTGMVDPYNPPVVAYLPAPLLSTLRAAVRDTVTLHVASGLEDLDTIFGLSPGSILVADPEAPGLCGEPARLLPVLERHP